MSKVLVALVLAACSNGSSPPQTVAIGDTGYVIDIPGDWSLTVKPQGLFLLRGLRAPVLQRMPGPAHTLDEIVEDECAGAKDIEREALPSGGAFVACRKPRLDGKGEIYGYQVWVPIDASSSFECWAGDSSKEKAQVAVRACKSIRRK